MTAVESSGSGARGKVPGHLWVVGVLALLWNGMGAFDYLATQFKLEFYMKQFTPEQLSYFVGFPAWAVSGWAFGVWGAFVGSIGLLLRKRWSVWAFAVSIVGMVVSSIYTFGLSEGAKIMGTGGAIFTGIIWVVAVFLLLYARAQAKRGTLA
jgi:hypothetical protein